MTVLRAKCVIVGESVLPASCPAPSQHQLTSQLYSPQFNTILRPCPCVLRWNTRKLHTTNLTSYATQGTQRWENLLSLKVSSVMVHTFRRRTRWSVLARDPNLPWPPTCKCCVYTSLRACLPPFHLFASTMTTRPLRKFVYPGVCCTSVYARVDLEPW